MKSRAGQEPGNDSPLSAEARLRFLLTLSDSFQVRSTSGGIPETAARLLGQHLSATHAFCVALDRDEHRGHDVHVIARDYRADADLPSVAGRYTQPPAARHFFAGLLKGEPLAVPDIGLSSMPRELAERCAAFGIRSALAVPLRKSGEFAGALVVSDSGPRTWTSDEIALAEETAERTWAALKSEGAEESLRRSEEKYRILFDSMDQGYALLELIDDEEGHAIDFRVASLNPAAVRIFGHLASAGKRLSELAPVDDAWLAAATRVVASGRSERFEAKSPWQERWFVVHVSRVDGAELQLLSVIFDDITSRKLRELNLLFLAEVSQELARMNGADDVLRVLAEKLGTYFGGSLCAFAETGRDLEKLTVAKEWARADAPGLGGDLCMGDLLTPELFRAGLAGETLVVPNSAADRRVNAPRLATLAIRSLLAVPVLRDGKWRFTAVVADSVPRNWREDQIELLGELANRIWAWLERLRADEARRESEERFRLFVDNVHEYALFQTDRSGVVSSWNPGATRLFGYTGEEMVGRDVSILLPPAERDSGILHREIERALHGERQHDARWLVRRDGSRFWAQWVTEPMRDEEGTERGVAKVLRDETERKTAEERQQILMGELNHRVKNTLAIVQAIASQTLRTTPEPARFVESFRARIDALARAHNLLTRRGWQAADVGEVLRDQLVAGADAERIQLTGEAALLTPQTAVALALVIHELGANARKHGALCVPEGSVKVSWLVDAASGNLIVHWAESGGPPVSEPTRTGFGSALIKRSLLGVGGSAELRFDPSGVTCVLRVPVQTA